MREALGHHIPLSLPLQAVIGGITVLTQLNPWFVSGHFLLSMLIIMFCIALLDEQRSPDRELAPPAPRRLAWARQPGLIRGHTRFHRWPQTSQTELTTRI